MITKIINISLLIFFLLATIIILYFFYGNGNVDDENIRVSSINNQAAKKTYLDGERRGINTQFHSKPVEIRLHDVINGYGDPILWIEQLREMRSIDEANCLESGGVVSKENLLLIGVAPIHIDAVSECLEILLSDLASIIADSISIQCDENGTYKVSRYREKTIPIFINAINDINLITGSYVAEKVIASFPLKMLIGRTGTYDVFFEISMEYIGADSDYQVPFLIYTAYNHDGSPRYREMTRGDAVKSRFLGTLEIDQ